MEIEKYLIEYNELVAKINVAVEKVKSLYADEYLCDNGCTDCCYSVFDITLIEAINIKAKFNEKFSGSERFSLVEESNKTDRTLNRMKKSAVKKLQKGDKEAKIIELISTEKIKCPLLNSNNKCEIYDFRPIACRISGIPAVSHGMTHTCGKAGFKPGVAYQTINMDTIYDKLYAISKKMMMHNSSKFKTMHELLMPVSMAVITDFNNEFLGI
jgi:Fe-S-cluster containining protein